MNKAVMRRKINSYASTNMRHHGRWCWNVFQFHSNLAINLCCTQIADPVAAD